MKKEKTFQTKNMTKKELDKFYKIKLTKEEANLLLQILESAMDDPALESAPIVENIKADIKRIYGKVWAEKVVLFRDITGCEGTVFGKLT